MDLRALDTETYLFRPGEAAPKIVCASTAHFDGDQAVGALVTGGAALDVFGELIRSSKVAFANAAYDLACAAQADPSLWPVIFRALAEGRVHDVLIAEALHAIYNGTLGEDPRTGGDLRSPSTGKVSKRYSLEIVCDLVLDRRDAKKNDAFRKSYALLDGIEPERWPEVARTYAVEDAVNTLEVAAAQIKSHKNLENLPAQVEAAFALHLGAAHGLRVDPEKLDKLAAEVEEKHAKAVTRFQKFGWVRENGTEDQAAVKRAVALAYGVTGTCERCGGSGRVQTHEVVPCRGEKQRGRYRGCPGAGCSVCSGLGSFRRVKGDTTCKNVHDEEDELVEEGCDGTGLDLSTVPMLPRTINKEHPFRFGGVSTDRDALMESGSDELSDYGENEFEKSRSTYIPYLRSGVRRPLTYSSNVIVNTGRGSYEGSPLHQMPRNGGERECIRARGAWCDYPFEMVLGSTDYEAGELCCLFQFCYWLFGYSRGRDAINASGKPGILHSDLASQVLGISLDEFLVRLKAKDKLAVDARQASKPYNFGKPARMGSPKIVLTNRKKSTGFTGCERGPAVNKKGEPGYWGIRFCVLLGGKKTCGDVKIMEWKRRSCAPVCKACTEIVEHVLGPAYFTKYPEIKDYFHWASKMIDRAKKEGRSHVLAPCAVWNEEEGAPKIIRERGILLEDYSALCNNAFQGMLSDITKRAYVAATRECYLGTKPDGSPSPLYGCRLPLVHHDEPLSELLLDTAHLSGPRIAEIMVEEGKKVAPDVVWRAETALAFWWSKSMESTYEGEMLVPWDRDKRAA